MRTHYRNRTAPCEREVIAWFRRRKKRVPHVSWVCLAYDHLAGRWKHERNRQWMLDILREMQRIKEAEFYGERQRLMREKYPKPS